MGIAVSGTDTYVSGTVGNNAGNLVPGIWKNDTWTGLPLPTSASNGVPQRLVLSGADVYTAGNVYNSRGQDRPGYWRNDIWVALPPPSPLTFAGTSAIVVVP
jgi:hypothetical protein